MANRDERGRWKKGTSGNPDTQWKKGTSGNPQGRKRALPDSVLKLFTENTEGAILQLMNLMNDPDPNIRLAATKYFIDKGIGTNFKAFIDEDENKEEEDFKIRIFSARKDG